MAGSTGTAPASNRDSLSSAPESLPICGTKSDTEMSTPSDGSGPCEAMGVLVASAAALEPACFERSGGSFNDLEPLDAVRTDLPEPFEPGRLLGYRRKADDDTAMEVILAPANGSVTEVGEFGYLSAESSTIHMSFDSLHDNFGNGFVVAEHDDTKTPPSGGNRTSGAKKQKKSLIVNESAMLLQSAIIPGFPGLLLQRAVQTMPAVAAAATAANVTAASSEPTSHQDYAQRRNYPKPRSRRRWSAADHDIFLEGVARYGRDWKKVTDYLAATKISDADDGEPVVHWCQRDVRSHAQKYFAKVQREETGAFVPAKKRNRKCFASEYADASSHMLHHTTVMLHPLDQGAIQCSCTQTHM